LYQENSMKEIVLALGGGGAKGSAHIGVLRVLEREGFVIRAISGTSVGAIVASLYAFGYKPDEIQHLMSMTDRAGMFARAPDDGPSWMGIRGIHDLLKDALGDCCFENLHLPCAVTAVDLKTAERLILGRGRVLDAVLASIALPGVFPPRNLDDRILVDGGVMDPVPVTVARLLKPDLPAVAVALSAPLSLWPEMGQPHQVGTLPILNRYFSKLRFSQALSIFMRSVDIGGALFAELHIQVEQPDVLIRPAVWRIGLLDQVDIAEVARLGEQAAEQTLSQLNRIVSWQARLWRVLRPRKAPNTRLPFSSDFYECS
jgi:NTE family protein